MDSTITPDYVDDDDDEPDDPVIKAARIQVKVKNIVKNWIFAMPNLDYTSRGYNVTPKLVKLVQILKACEPQGDLFRGIVFGNALTKAIFPVITHCTPFSMFSAEASNCTRYAGHFTCVE